MRFSLCCIVLLTIGPLACSHPNEKRNLFPLALEEFNTALVWKNYTVAASYLDFADARGEVARLRRRSEKVRIVEVEPLESRVAADGDTATALIRFSWYGEADLTVHNGVELQTWKRVNGEWRMNGRKRALDKSLEPSPFLPEDSAEPPPEEESAPKST